MWGNGSTKNEEALETILKEGEVEETSKTGQRYGMLHKVRFTNL
jgi:hypothetical protein